MTQSKLYDWRSQAVGGAVVNALINGGLGLLLVGPDGRLPLWGLPSLSFDLAAMAFGIAFGTGLVVTLQLRTLEAKGRLQCPALPPPLAEGFAKWPDAVFHRAFNLGVLGVLIFAPLPLAVLAFGFPEGFDRMGLVVFKGLFGAFEGAVVTPIIGLAAFRTPVVAPALPPAD
jgi:hypothetical protein